MGTEIEREFQLGILSIPLSMQAGFSLLNKDVKFMQRREEETVHSVRKPPTELVVMFVNDHSKSGWKHQQ